MKLTIKDCKGQNQGELEIRLAVIEDGRASQAVHDAVVAQGAARRRGTACTKTMGEVAGTGKKPWRQKGTGRARAGSFASPLWRGGGVVFGPKPRDFRKKVSKGTRRLALRKALSERLKAGDVMVVDELALSAPRTRELAGVFAALELSGTTLMVAEGSNRNLLLASRNLAGVELVRSQDLNPHQVLRFRNLLFTRRAFEEVEERLAG